MVPNFTLIKRNKRLYVECDGVAIYTPADWLRPFIHGRERFQAMVDAMNAGVKPIKAIVAFETACRP